ncbi:ThiF family adenylyltransferase [Thermogutta sp.]|uniref:ThiF family adenylyltransferase n=1 Tax=Thermogutta sp. TaxID=1962930 RepID=UPI003220987A
MLSSRSDLETSLRYLRQIQFADLGAEGQKRLAEARALVCGCGALGTMVANHLVRAGVGFVRIVDRDLVDLSNLHRQCLFDEEDARRQLPKAVAAADKLQRINSEVRVEPIVADIRSDNIGELAQDVDLLVDGTDNFETRFLLNDYAIRQNVPWIFAACLGAQGQVMVVLPGETPCLRCLIPTLPPAGTLPTCETAGILGPVVGVVASLEAMEALKILAGRRDAVTHDLIVVNLWPVRLRQISLTSMRDPSCPTCVEQRFEFLEHRRESTSVALCGRKTVQVTPPEGRCDLDEIHKRWNALGEVERCPYFLRLRTPDWTLTLFPDGRALITGIDDPVLGRTIYARFVGM